MAAIAGILGLVIGLTFIGIAIAPFLLWGETPPIMVRAALLGMGGILILCSVLAIRHGFRAVAARRNGEKVPVRATVEVDDSSDSTSYTIYAEFNGERWAVSAYGGRGVQRLEAGTATNVFAWRHPATGAPLAFEVDGHPVRTYPVARRV
ncbi:hypothetical protein [Hasllibacter sp. MH4015]|uniref:hypothetical protein n=1 Tax=Hasllibacter sp. MH4015 TaxID=2854029 RepID=UPI001CD71512|nr:hypothetical protein [Hasllibacter sp. MH4015]